MFFLNSWHTGTAYGLLYFNQYSLTVMNINLKYVLESSTTKYKTKLHNRLQISAYSNKHTGNNLTFI